MTFGTKPIQPITIRIVKHNYLFKCYSALQNDMRQIDTALKKEIYMHIHHYNTHLKLFKTDFSKTIPHENVFKSHFKRSSMATGDIFLKVYWTHFLPCLSLECTETNQHKMRAFSTSDLIYRGTNAKVAAVFSCICTGCYMQPAQSYFHSQKPS